MKHLKNLNIFGHPISFQVNDGIIYKSYIGTFVTLIIIASGLYIFIELMKQMYARETPNIVRTEERVDSSKPEEHQYTLDRNTIILFGLADSKGVVIKPDNDQGQVVYRSEVFVHSTYYNQTSDKQEEIIISLEMRRCDLLPDIETIAKEIDFDLTLARLAYCPVIPTEGLLLKGVEVSRENTRIAFQIKKCDPKNKTYTCAPEEDFNKTLNGIAIIGVTYQKYFPKIVGKPFKNKFIYDKMFLKNDGSQATFLMYFNKIVSKTVENFLYFDKKTFIEEGLESSIIQKAYVSESNETSIAAGAIVLSQNLVNYERSYGNILNIFGDLGGLLNILIFIGRIITAPLEHLSFKIYTFMKIYKIDNEADEDNDEQQQLLNKKQIVPGDEEADEGQIKVNENTTPQQSFKEQVRKKLDQKQKKKKRKSMMNIIQDDKLRGIVWKGKDIIIPQLNFYELIKVRSQFESLLEIILSQEQKILFDFIISEKNHIPYDLDRRTLRKKKSIIQELGTDKLFRSYEELQEKDDELSQKLIEKVNKILNVQEESRNQSVRNPLQENDKNKEKKEKQELNNGEKKDPEQFEEILNDIEQK